MWPCDTVATVKAAAAGPGADGENETPDYIE
jgi:hypothetical protein